MELKAFFKSTDDEVELVMWAILSGIATHEGKAHFINIIKKPDEAQKYAELLGITKDDVAAEMIRCGTEYLNNERGKR